MERLETPKQSRLEIVSDIIKNSREAVEREFARSANDWLSCFGSQVFVIETYLTTEKAEQELGVEKFKDIEVKLEGLKSRLLELKKIYPKKDTIPPDQIKDELMRMLNVID